MPSRLSTPKPVASCSRVALLVDPAGQTFQYRAQMLRIEDAQTRPQKAPERAAGSSGPRAGSRPGGRDRPGWQAGDDCPAARPAKRGQQCEKEGVAVQIFFDVGRRFHSFDELGGLVAIGFGITTRKRAWASS